MFSPFANRSKIITEMMKFSFHHRAFYCYVGMSLWIFFLITVMYKYLSVGEEAVVPKKVVQTHYISKTDAKFRKIYLRACNPPENIVRGTEGVVDRDTWLLQGVLVLTRHGDRGPLTHLKGGDKLLCDTEPNSALLRSYEEFVANASASSGRAYWVAGPGPFHNFPSLPPHAAGTHCALGQLTPRGLLQMLTVGTILRDAYGDKLPLNTVDPLAKKDTGEVISISTRYRRTFQSLVGLLWGAWGSRAGALAAAAKETHSVAFCAADCACAKHHQLNKKINTQTKNRLESHPAIKELVIKLSKVLFESQEHIDADVVRDALLAYMCHEAPFPCSEKPKPKSKVRGHKKLRAEHAPLRSLLNVDIDTLNIESEVAIDNKKLRAEHAPLRSLLNVDTDTLNMNLKVPRDNKKLRAKHAPLRSLLNADIDTSNIKTKDAIDNKKLRAEHAPLRSLLEADIDTLNIKSKDAIDNKKLRAEHAPLRSLLNVDTDTLKVPRGIKKLRTEHAPLRSLLEADIDTLSIKSKVATDHEKMRAERVPLRSLLDVDIDTLNMELDYINNQLDFNNEIGRKARDIINKYYDGKDKKVPLDFDAQMEREKLLYYQQRYMDNADAYDDVVIVKKNLDADFNFPNDARMDTDFDEDYKEPTESPEDFCIMKEHVMSLFAYLEWSYRQEIRNVHNRRRGLLVAYGLIHNIVQNMIRMISENKPKYVLYSGHDKTLQALILALGLNNYQHYNIQYASRMIFEVYRKRDLRDEFKGHCQGSIQRWAQICTERYNNKSYIILKVILRRNIGQFCKKIVHGKSKLFTSKGLRLCFAFITLF